MLTYPTSCAPEPKYLAPTSLAAAAESRSRCCSPGAGSAVTLGRGVKVEAAYPSNTLRCASSVTRCSSETRFRGARAHETLRKVAGGCKELPLRTADSTPANSALQREVHSHRSAPTVLGAIAVEDLVDRHAMALGLVPVDLRL